LIHNSSTVPEFVVSLIIQNLILKKKGKKIMLVQVNHVIGCCCYRCIIIWNTKATINHYIRKTILIDFRAVYTNYNIIKCENCLCTNMSTILTGVFFSSIFWLFSITLKETTGKNRTSYEIKYQLNRICCHKKRNACRDHQSTFSRQKSVHRQRFKNNIFRLEYLIWSERLNVIKFVVLFR